jgi:hypothetical protein
MTDTPDTPATPETPAQFDDFVRFMVAKNDEYKCSVCSEGSWTVLLDNDDTIVTEFQNNTTKTRTMFPSYCLVCTNCGYMSMHMARIVDSWISKNPATVATDDE